MSESIVIAEVLKKGGGVGAVAKALNMSAEGVRLWRARGQIPASRVVELEQLTGVPRAQLRPDLYGPPATS